MGDGVQIGEAFVRVRADTKEAGSAIADLGGVAAKALGGLAVSGFFAAGIQGIQNAEKRTAQLEARLKSTGGAAGISASEIKGLAGSLSTLTGISGAAITEAETLLLTFKSISNSGPEKTFERATRAALDLSTAFGSDLKGATVMIGKALEDPISGVSALRRVGVQLTEQQTEMIRTMVETGDVAGAQGVILDELASQVGGAAEAYGTTLSAQMDRVKQKFTGLAMAASQTLIPALEAISTVALPAIQGLAGVINELPPGLKTVAALATVAFGASKIAMVGKFTTAIKSLTLAQGGAISVAAIGAIAWQRWKAGLEAAKAAAEGLKGVVEESYPSYDEMQSKMKGLEAGISEIGSSIERSKAPWDIDYRAQLKEYNAGLQNTRDLLANEIGLVEGLAQSQGISNQAAADAVQHARGLGIEITTTDQAIAAYTGGTAEAEAATRRAGHELATAAQRADEYASALAALTSPVLGAVEAERRMADAQRELQEARTARSEATTTADAAEADRRIKDAELATLQAAEAVDASRMRLGAAAAEDPTLIERNVAQYRAWHEAGLITAGTLNSITQAVTSVRRAALPQELHEMRIQAEAAPASITAITDHLRIMASQAGRSADEIKRIWQAWLQLKSLEAELGLQASAFTSPAARDKFFADYEAAQRSAAATNAYIDTYGPRPRAIGGRVSAGDAYQVGEAAPEFYVDPQGRQYLIPAQSGHVTSAPEPSGAATTNITINLTGSATDADARMMIAALRSEAWLVGAGG